MKISVIYAHPYEKSFNAAIAETAVAQLKSNGHTVMFHDLYKEGFDPVVTGKELSGEKCDDELVLRHQQEIRETDGIIIIHPNWWGQPPAILKGWVDRVLWVNVAYAFVDGDTSGIPIGLLKAKAALVFNTSNTPEERENTVFGDPLQRIWKDCILNYCGVTVFDRVMFRVIDESTENERASWLNEVRDMVIKYFPKLS